MASRREGSERRYLKAATKVEAPHGGETPFIAITRGVRILIIGYFLVYKVLTPGLDMMLHGLTAPLQEWLFAADVAYQALVFLPILFYRSTYGWLHPLMFATFFGLAKGLAESPEQLFTPLLVFSGPLTRPMEHGALLNWTQQAIAWAALKASLISLTARALYYLGFFFAPQPRIPRLMFPQPRNVVTKALTVVTLSAVVFLVYIQSQGGLTAHMSSWSHGRFEALAGDGPIFVLIQTGAVASLIWFALNKTASRNPLFWIAVMFSVPVYFFAAGSRSSLFYACVLFLMIWMLRHQKIPHARIIILGVGAFILFGALGMLRESTWKGEVDWTVLTDFDLHKSLEAADEEADLWRNNSGYLPIIAKVPERVDLLYGRSYVGSLLFFVPRALWPDKPRGAGFLNTQMIFQENPLPGAGAGSGIPPGPVGEAYWNFHIPGVVVVFFLYGLFHRWLARTFTQYAREPAAWPLYVITLFTFSPAGLSIVQYFQEVIPAIAILYWTGALSFKNGFSVSPLRRPLMPVRGRIGR